MTGVLLDADSASSIWKHLDYEQQVSLSRTWNHGDESGEVAQVKSHIRDEDTQGQISPSP